MLFERQFNVKRLFGALPEHQIILYHALGANATLLINFRNQELTQSEFLILWSKKTKPKFSIGLSNLYILYAHAFRTLTRRLFPSKETKTSSKKWKSIKVHVWVSNSLPSQEWHCQSYFYCRKNASYSSVLNFERVKHYKQRCVHDGASIIVSERFGQTEQVLGTRSQFTVLVTRLMIGTGTIQYSVRIMVWKVAENTFPNRELANDTWTHDEHFIDDSNEAVLW